MIDIRLDDLSGAETRALIAEHLGGMHANSPPGGVYALDLSGLTAPDIRMWSAWIGGDIAGVGALRALSATQGEVKSMRTRTRHLRKGVAAALLTHIIDVAQRQGMTRLSLETGGGPAFEPALSLYRRFGFKTGEAFGDYAPSAFNQFLHLDL